MPGGPARRRRPYVVIGSAIVLVAAVLLGYVALFGWPAGVDAAQERTMRASIISYLEQRHWRGVLEARRSKQKVRWICADRLIEVSRDGGNYKVGLHALCQEFTAVDGSLVKGSGESSPKLATVTSPDRPVEVLRVEQPPDGSGYGSWVRSNFSWAGVTKLRRIQRSLPADLEATMFTKARSAFGLSADAPVRG
ncbi:hypothetical protein C8D87_1011196 [Lentzea atacamensis]|uniref:Uncharacterized protein n=1 Tax=Lentzea atacamensis TaxID=531938 RepID=A0ABX9EI84_9PSEU|nr:hypothetical protein [Lentzea atacamensis]RAS70895.1 hypothetical protein C8D87_1011196 [Lentzea atacamensis]